MLASSHHFERVAHFERSYVFVELKVRSNHVAQYCSPKGSTYELTFALTAGFRFLTFHQMFIDFMHFRYKFGRCAK